jgi:hypothetical protein
MAQDFRATFGLGDDDRTYFAVDAQGVALAAIQALHAEVQRLGEQNAALSRDLADVRSQLARDRRIRSRR